MHTYTTRAGRWPLALSLFGLAVLTACADEPVGPMVAPTAPVTSAFSGPTEITVTVTNASGGTEVGSLQWAVDQLNTPGPTTGVVVFDPSLAGDTIVLDAPLQAQRPMQIIGPVQGITLSGRDQHRVITSGTSLLLRNLTLTNGNADLGSAVMAPSLEMRNTTVQNNRGPTSAVYAGALVMINSTVSGNTVGRNAVEYAPTAYVFIDHSTIAYNSPAAGLGPSSYPSQGLTVTLRNSILANNGTENCSSFFGFGYIGTVISSDWSCGEVGLTIADPMLMPLADNGGPNETHAIPHTSPAYNASTNCSEPIDQRYVQRDTKCDAGAFEFNDFTNITLTIDPNVRVDAATGRAMLTGTIKCSRDETLKLALELEQDQKMGKDVVDVHAASNPQVTCGPTPRAWSQKMILSEGAWQNGAARATAQTIELPQWAKPASAASAVKLAITRK